MMIDGRKLIETAIPATNIPQGVALPHVSIITVYTTTYRPRLNEQNCITDGVRMNSSYQNPTNPHETVPKFCGISRVSQKGLPI